eukprot:1203204-Prorocentrum_lima.AAC.1
MTSSLVGSEMCIRDSWKSDDDDEWICPVKLPSVRREESPHFGLTARRICLLYTSDAADDM